MSVHVLNIITENIMRGHMERHLVGTTTAALVTSEHMGGVHRRDSRSCPPPTATWVGGGWVACSARLCCLKQPSLPGSCRAELCDTPPRSSAWGCDTPLSAWRCWNWAGPACIQRGRSERGSLGWLRYPNSIFKQAGWESLLSFPERRNQSGIQLLTERMELACLWED